MSADAGGVLSEDEGFANLTSDRSIPMTDEAMSPLRRRMIEDMTIRKLAPKTQQGYVRIIRNFAAFLGRPPNTASFEDVRRFQLHLVNNGAQIPILNHSIRRCGSFSGLRSTGPTSSSTRILSIQPPSRQLC